MERGREKYVEIHSKFSSIHSIFSSPDISSQFSGKFKTTPLQNFWGLSRYESTSFTPGGLCRKNRKSLQISTMRGSDRFETLRIPSKRESRCDEKWRERKPLSKS
ncbi:hypothetical protein AKJ66_02410 [candidate division MSBL1 archaeon SCGC-AAA259E22]|uniref:Uncharacterized protein n=1 Tax=candidate division MSBL1 archaeon SCGC-AAA259E22 TaxID=1698265 RepID=A0A133UG90_9EURY|nr:hypothetical protein AKJ66_02410 [candidate division MSBL1 archaeon SCGC-AAA259E22]